MVGVRWQHLFHAHAILDYKQGAGTLLIKHQHEVRAIDGTEICVRHGSHERTLHPARNAAHTTYIALVPTTWPTLLEPSSSPATQYSARYTHGNTPHPSPSQLHGNAGQGRQVLLRPLRLPAGGWVGGQAGWGVGGARQPPLGHGGAWDGVGEGEGHGADSKGERARWYSSGQWHASGLEWFASGVGVLSVRR